MGYSDDRCQKGSVRCSVLPQDGQAQSWSQSRTAPNLPRTSPTPSSSIQMAAMARQTHLPLAWDKSGGRVTSWIKYLGCQGVWRFSRFRSSTRCFSSRCRFCSVAASMSPSRRYLVTSCQRFLGMHAGEEVVRQGQLAWQGQFPERTEAGRALGQGERSLGASKTPRARMRIQGQQVPKFPAPSMSRAACLSRGSEGLATESSNSSSKQY